MRQGILAFGPRAVLPENPNVGAAIISGPVPQPSKGEEVVEDVAPKGRRDLDNYKRAAPCRVSGRGQVGVRISGPPLIDPPSN